LAIPMCADAAPSVRAAAIRLLAELGSGSVLEPALDAMSSREPAVRAAAVHALALVDAPSSRERLDAFADEHASSATSDHALASAVPADAPATSLLHDALLDRGRRHALDALTALALLSEQRGAIREALDHLDGSDPAQLANALETLEVTARTPQARSLLGLWEETAQRQGPHPGGNDDWLARCLEDRDDVIRSCAELVQTERGDDMTRSRPSMSATERVIVLRTVPLFAGLAPGDLFRVAGIAEERTFEDGDVLAEEGEIGGELHIVVTGSVRVVRDAGGLASTIARRGPGDVVGEMSIITRAPRIASPA
jgi:hypothetical protein